jgi:hypothetical protein
MFDDCYVERRREKEKKRRGGREERKLGKGERVTL